MSAYSETQTNVDILEAFVWFLFLSLISTLKYVYSTISHISEYDKKIFEYAFCHDPEEVVVSEWSNLIALM